MEIDRYRHIARRLVCENRRFDVFFDTIEAPDGLIVPDFLIVRPKVNAEHNIVGVCILPEVGGKIGLMRGWRHQLEEEVWQAPAGFLEPGETAAFTALRELHEETTLACDQSCVRALGTYLPDAGLIEGRVALFVGKDCRMKGEGASRDREAGAGRLYFFDREELLELLLSSGQIGGSTLVACFQYLQWQTAQSD